ncbi:hypothetical protein DFH09DRAFT_1178853 [Mycena vulgaris]|nr:hypothetical protein DFH09DRAFT_1178853 [Mycena vulgaris]
MQSPRFFLAFPYSLYWLGTSTAAHAACWNTSVTPSPNFAEHLRYFCLRPDQVFALCSCISARNGEENEPTSSAVNLLFPSSNARRSVLQPTRNEGSPLQRCSTSAIHCRGR